MKRTQGIAKARGLSRAAPLGSAPPPAPIYRVSKKSFTVFHALFFKPNESSPPGAIPWVDFVKAMESTGFEGKQVRGSAWEFRNDHQSIQFHQPHPSSKLEFYTARGYGKRLTDKFGWHSEMFVLK